MVSSLKSQIQYSVVAVVIVEAVTGMGGELKVRNQTRMRPYRVESQTVSTVKLLGGRERSGFQQDPSVRKRWRIYISGDAQHALLSRLPESVKQPCCKASRVVEDCRLLCS